MSRKIKVLVVPVGKAPEVREIEATLEDMQEIVGGYIEAHPLEGYVDLICNEEGWLRHLPVNRLVPSVDKICGDFFVARRDKDGDNVSLTDADIAKYSQKFSALA